MVSLRVFLRLGLCTVFLISLVYGLSGCQEEKAVEPATEEATEEVKEKTTVIKLWSQGTPAFGLFAPSEREHGAVGPDGHPLPPLYTQAGGERLALNDTIDFVFLDLEHGGYNFDAATAIQAGLESGKAKGGGEKSLIVRIPAIETDGEDAARQRVAEVLGAGADGVVLPFIRSAEMARTAVSFFTDAGADVWGPQNPDGTVIAWLMIEDPDALAQVEEIANVPGYSVLVCGVGSMTDALGEDPEAGEAANQLILEHSKRTGHPNATLAATPAGFNVYDRIDQGFLGLLGGGPGADEIFRMGRKYVETGERVKEQTTVIKLWSQGTPAFGVFIPSEREHGAVGPDGEPLPPLYTQAGGERLALNELIDFAFLDLEHGGYNFDAVGAIMSGLRIGKAKGGSEKTFLVRIPAIETDGEDAARKRVAEVLGAGAGGVVFPFIRSAEMARTAVSFFTEAGADVWGPQNPDGTVIAFFMIEDPDALAEVEAIANVPGYSVLVCGFGSMTEALGDPKAAEAANQLILEHAKRTGHPNVALLFDDVTDRIDQGFLGLVGGGPDVEKNLRIGRKHLENR